MSEADPFLAFLARFCLVLIFPLSALNKVFDYQSAIAQASTHSVLEPASIIPGGQQSGSNHLGKTLLRTKVRTVSPRRKQSPTLWIMLESTQGLRP